MTSALGLKAALRKELKGRLASLLPFSSLPPSLSSPPSLSVSPLCSSLFSALLFFPLLSLSLLPSSMSPVFVCPRFYRYISLLLFSKNNKHRAKIYLLLFSFFPVCPPRTLLPFLKANKSPTPINQ